MPAYNSIKFHMKHGLVNLFNDTLGTLAKQHTFLKTNE